MANSTVYAWLDATETGLEAVVPSGTSVFTMPMMIDQGSGPDMVQFGNIELDEEYMAMGGSRFEQYNIEGSVFVQRPGNGEAEAKEARSRVKTIMDTVETYFRNNPTAGGAKDAQFTSLKLSQGWSEDRGSRVCRCDFTISIRAAK